MKQLLCLFLLFTTLGAPLGAQTALDKLSPDLQSRINDNPEALQEVFVLLSDQVNTLDMLVDFETRKPPLRERHYQVVTALQQKAAATQPAFIARIKSLGSIEDATISPLWVVNAVYLKANKKALLDIAAWPETGELIWNAPAVTDFSPSAVQAAPPGPNNS